MFSPRALKARSSYCFLFCQRGDTWRQLNLFVLRRREAFRVGSLWSSVEAATADSTVDALMLKYCICTKTLKSIKKSHSKRCLKIKTETSMWPLVAPQSGFFLNQSPISLYLMETHSIVVGKAEYFCLFTRKLNRAPFNLVVISDFKGALWNFSHLFMLADVSYGCSLLAEQRAAPRRGPWDLDNSPIL